ncbi:hypothetical protein amrb99_12560 [Actinomadura sp. RB99]|uniref:hypothetical protein n=1 Tax=Actinomadura sp. RB99 TaxID=2691577 RepID=UPI001688F96E|nr:hypothetical protein [Actinomadura sp. RB99]MBD2892346.1 hypothetical protein [Actinomadura sp. RB99]
MEEIERVVPREKLTVAVEVIASFVPETDEDAAEAWRAELVKRYRTAQQCIELLLETIEFRAVEAGRPVLATVAAAAAMAKSRRRYDRADVAEHEGLVTGSWRPLVFACVTAASCFSSRQRVRSRHGRSGHPQRARAWACTTVSSNVPSARARFHRRTRRARLARR